MTAFYSFPTPLARGTLARAEKVNENLQAIADSLAYFGDAAKWVDHRPNYIADSGAVNAYVVTLDPVPSAYRVGMTFDMVASIVNTGASTVNVNGLGVKTITDSAGAALAAGAIPAGRVTTLVYDGTNFRTIAAVSTTVPADNSVTVAKLATPLSDMAAGLSASWNPATDDTTTLGTATHRWGGAFYKSGGAINWNNGDVTITHSANALTFAGAANGYLFDAAILPLSSDGAAIGSTALMWSDAFLASGAVLNFNNGNYTITHSAGTLTFSAGASFGAALLPTADDGAALGSTTKEWSDLFLATGGVVNWNNGDVTLTHAANQLTFGGASSGYLFDAVTAPSSNDGAPLGSVTNQWSDLFLATGGVMNFANGNMTITHSSGILDFSTGIYRFQSPSSSTPGSGNNLSGIVIDSAGTLYSSRGGNSAVFNRTADGNLVNFNSAGVNQGIISISGATTTYGAFFGSHWSQLKRGAAKIDIKRGTIVETIDDMCEWLALSYVDHEGNHHLDESAVKRYYRIGDQVDYTYTYPYDDFVERKVRKGKRLVKVRERVVRYAQKTVKATVVLQPEERLPRFKISDKAGSKAVYGVFGWWEVWDGKGKPPTDDAFIGALGAFVVRVAKEYSPERGDLIESNGDGCGRIQADDLMRASTVAKITSGIPVEEYDDGSRLYPCTLHCG